MVLAGMLRCLLSPKIRGAPRSAPSPPPCSVRGKKSPEKAPPVPAPRLLAGPGGRAPRRAVLSSRNLLRTPRVPAALGACPPSLGTCPRRCQPLPSVPLAGWLRPACARASSRRGFAFRLLTLDVSGAPGCKAVPGASSLPLRAPTSLREGRWAVRQLNPLRSPGAWQAGGTPCNSAAAGAFGVLAGQPRDGAGPGSSAYLLACLSASLCTERARRAAVALLWLLRALICCLTACPERIGDKGLVG